MTFESFYKTLISEQAWFEAVQMTYRNKDYKQVAMECYTWLLTQPSLWKSQDYVRYRQSYQKFLLYAAEKIDNVVRHKAEPVVIHPQALTGEAREKRIKEFLGVLAKVGQPVRHIPEKDVFEEGQWDKKKLVEMVPSKVEQVTAAREHLATAQRARRKLFIEAFPDASEEEIQAYLEKFLEIDNPLGL